MSGGIDERPELYNYPEGNKNSNKCKKYLKGF